METYTQLITDGLGRFTQDLMAFLPSLIAPLLLLVFGWILAKTLRTIILRFGIGIDRLVTRFRLGTGQESLPLRRKPSGLVASVVYWLTLFFFFTAAIETLGLPGLAAWLGSLFVYLPDLIAGGLIMLIGYFLGGWARNAILSAASASGLASADPLSRLAQTLILTIAIILGIGQFGLDTQLLINVATIATAALLGGLGLAFGLGAAPSVGNIIASHYVRKAYRIGQKVRVADIEGEILEITPTDVVLDTDDGRAMIPAKLFGESACLLLNRED